MPRRKGERILRPVHPNVGLQVEYRKKIDRMVAEMARSYEHWLRAQYRAKPPVMAQDASPAADLQREIARLGKQWEKRFEYAAPRLARWFATSVERRSMRSLMGILKEGGIAVDFVMTKGMRDVFAATVAENVSLIKSIGSQYHTEVEGLVMRSAAAGRDLSFLTKELKHRYGVTDRRAKLIAKDQNNKTTAVFTRVRQQEVGIEEAVWLHSHGGNEPRPTHLANSGKRYKIAEGWYDPDPRVQRHIWPGELINCFPADTQINAASDVEVAYRHWHSGELTVLSTDTGKTLRTTVNHPILTPLGWKGAGLLDEGDYVVEIAGHGIDGVEAKLNEDQGVALIEQIFISMYQARGREAQIALRADFHGDVVDSDVDIVFSDRLLSYGGHIPEGIEQFALSMSDHPALSGGPLSQFGIGPLLPPDGIVSGGGQLASLGRRQPRHSLKHGLTLVPDGPAYALDPSLDCFTLVPELASNRQDALPAFVKGAQLGRIIRVERRRFSGHVFNLQTKAGLYSAEGIIVHNCRCVPKPVVKGFS